MTVFKKCESCRARKIKCDERQPCCTPCIKKALNCVYKHCQRSSIFVQEQLASLISEDQINKGNQENTTHDNSNEHDTLRIPANTPILRLKRRREIGDGAVQVTFTIQPAKPSRRKRKRVVHQADFAESDFQDHQHFQRISRSIENGLLMRWHFNFYESPCGESKSASIYDVWTKAIPFLIGHADYLDLAATYFIDGMELLLYRSESHERRVYTTGQRALKSLRQTVESAAENTNPAHILIAIILHRYAESFKVLNTNSHVPHMQAIGRIVRQMPSSMMQDGVIACVRSNVFEDEVLEALLRGNDSCFDDYDTIPPPKSTSNRVNDALLALQGLFIRLPRLARLVRAAQEHDTTPIIGEALQRAYNLSQELFTSTNDGFIQETLAEETTVSILTCPPMAPIEGLGSLNFRSGGGFMLAAKYYTYRLLLCGLMLRVLSFGPLDPVLDEEEIRAEDMSAATAVAMCVKFALGRPDSHPLIAMRLFLPVQMAFGAWYRFEKLERSGALFDTPEYRKAVRMKRWCLGIAQKLDHIWGNIPTDEQQLEEVCEIFAGGPLPDCVAGWAQTW